MLICFLKQLYCLKNICWVKFYDKMFVPSSWTNLTCRLRKELSFFFFLFSFILGKALSLYYYVNVLFDFDSESGPEATLCLPHKG